MKITFGITKVSVVATAIFTLFTTSDIAFAQQPHQKQLTECIPSASDPCANIVDLKVDHKFKGKRTERPFRVEREKAGDLTINQSLIPEAATRETHSSERRSDIPASRALVPMRVVLDNYTRYPSYWRLLAVRGNTAFYWPSPSRYYTIGGYARSSISIRCYAGETVFFGAGSTNGVWYWGWGEDFDQSCTGSHCRIRCGRGTISIPMR